MVLVQKTFPYCIIGFFTKSNDRSWRGGGYQTCLAGISADLQTLGPVCIAERDLQFRTDNLFYSEVMDSDVENDIYRTGLVPDPSWGPKNLENRVF